MNRTYPPNYQHTVRDTVRKAKKDGAALSCYPVLMLEPMVGLEPTTCCLRNSFPWWTELPLASQAALECER